MTKEELQIEIGKVENNLRAKLSEINNREQKPPREKILDYMGIYVLAVIFIIGLVVGFGIKSLI